MSIFSFIKSHAVLAGTVVVVAVAGGVIAGRVSSRHAATAPTDSNTKHVALVDADSFRTDSDVVSVDGVIQSVSQVDLKSQISAPITSVRVALGDHVQAGQTLVELSNADIRAQLQSAQAALTVAAGTYAGSRQTAIDKIRSSYQAADTALHGMVDQYILNTISPTPALFSYLTDPILGNKIRDERTDLTTRLGVWKTVIDGLSASSSDSYVRSALETSEANLDRITVLFTDISSVLSNAANNAVSTTLTSINAIQSVVSQARSNIAAAKSALVSTESLLEGAQGAVGSAAQASVLVAESNVQNLQAQLVKTLIISPISGRVAALPLRAGELAAPGTLIATVVGPEGLQVDAFASAEDIARISRGSVVSIGGTATGTVSLISPSVNPINKKVEVKILIQNPDASGLVIGQTVNAHIKATPVVGLGMGGGTYRLPIQNVKIVPGHAYVFTVDTDSKLVRHEVTLGTVTGDFVEITAGMTPNMKIVSPVYELEDGQTVITD